MRKIAQGEDRFFNLKAEDGLTLSGYSAKYELVGLLGVVKSEPVVISEDNTSFEVKLDTQNIEPKTYELRIMVTNISEDFTFCAYTEQIQIRK